MACDVATGKRLLLFARRFFLHLLIVSLMHCENFAVSTTSFCNEVKCVMYNTLINYILYNTQKLIYFLFIKDTSFGA